MSSLLDALFLDPYPLNFFIAYRSDNQFGSGTAADPWNGSGTGNFDARMVDIMNLVLAQEEGQTVKLGARVFLGPGTFTTKGYSDDVQTNKGSEMTFGIFLWFRDASAVRRKLRLE